MAPLKARERAAEKISKEYKGDAAHLVDVVRCSVVVDTEAELIKVWDEIVEHGELEVVRLKNRCVDRVIQNQWGCASF